MRHWLLTSCLVGCGGAKVPTDMGPAKAPIDLAATSTPSDLAARSAPAPAASAGYDTNTFSTTAFSAANVDLSDTYAPGYQWYAFSCFGTTPTQANNTVHGDGSISIGQGGNTYNANLSSVGCTSSSTFVGTAFGGGMYVEASLKFDAVSDPTLATSNGWPAWWTFAVEPMVGLPAAQWPGQASGYVHYFEGDIMEYFQGAFSYPDDVFNATNHEWYGTDSANYGVATTATEPSAAFFSSYHTYGMLWVPATATTMGTITYYVDGAVMTDSSSHPAITSYTQWTDQAPPPSADTPWAFGVADEDHLVLLFGSNDTYPITVNAVNVWQASASGNLAY